MEVHFLPKPRLPESVGLRFPESLARGRRRQGCDGGVAAAGGERRLPSGLVRDRPRLRGPRLWGGAVRQLSRPLQSGGNNPAGRSLDLQAMGNGPAAFGPLYPLTLGDHPLLPHRPQEIAAVTSARTGPLCLPLNS